LVLPLRFTRTDLYLSEGRICGYEDGAEGRLAEERGAPRSDVFSIFCALSDLSAR
jgi:hypothetical protein